MEDKTSLELLISHLGDAPDGQLATPLAKECQNFVFVDDAGAARFIRDIVDKIVYTGGASSYVIQLLTLTFADFPESEEQKVARRDALERDWLGWPEERLNSRQPKREPEPEPEPLSQEELLEKLYAASGTGLDLDEGLDEGLDALIQYVGARFPDGVAFIGCGGAGDLASIDALLEALDVERLDVQFTVGVLSIVSSVKSALKQHQPFLERAEAEAARSLPADKIENLFRHFRTGQAR